MVCIVEGHIVKLEKVEVTTSDGLLVWYVIDTIKDKDTGLDGYVLQKEGTDELVISFRGTEFNGLGDFDKGDIREDIHGIILGNSDYTKNSR